MAEAATSRVDLYRALSDAGRLRLLALCAEEELTVSEAAQVTGESQPQVSKKAAVLRGLGLLDSRKEGTSNATTVCGPTVCLPRVLTVEKA